MECDISSDNDLTSIDWANMTSKENKQDGTGEEKPSRGAKSNKQVVSDEEVRQESSKAANASMNAKQKAKELKDAAAAAGDPDERQKLTEQAVNAQIEAESFGKTAKYMRSGAFQGLAVGTGLGVAPGATLGAVTGILVGGVTSTITGGLGGGIGTAAGALHGPILDVGKLAGKGVRKFTGNLPEWVASDEQKRSLEKMMGQIQEEDMPDDRELQKLHEEGESATADEGWMKSVTNMIPSMGGEDKSSQSTEKHDSDVKKGFTSGDEQEKKVPAPGSSRTSDTEAVSRKKPRKLESKPNNLPEEGENSSGASKQPKKLETRSNDKCEAPAKAEAEGGDCEWVARDKEEIELLRQHRAKKRVQEQKESKPEASKKRQPRKLETRS